LACFFKFVGTTPNEFTERFTEQNVASRKIDLVAKGGGIKGIALIGALFVLESQGFQIQHWAGTSAGGIITTLNAAGYTGQELFDLLSHTQFRAFADKGWEDHILGEKIGAAVSVFKDEGIFEGNALENFLRELLAAKGVSKFGDLRLDDPSSTFQHKAQVVVSDLTSKEALVLPRDAGKLGIDPDDLDVALALRMTSSIPLFFEPVKVRNPQTREEHVIVDGGMLSNFPVWIFDSQGTPRWPTFGLLLVDSDRDPKLTKHASPSVFDRLHISDSVKFVTSLISTGVEAHDSLYLKNADFVRTVAIPNLGVGTTEFDLSPERMTALFDSGKNATSRFLQTWSFERYVEQFRTDPNKPVQSRAQTLQRTMMAERETGMRL
jgi:NTE family protein